MSEDALVSISEASHSLGVSEAALRQWTDEGKIKAFITPGGHRRYSKAELKKFMSAHRKMLGVRDLVAELEDTVRQHREIARTSFSTTAWYNQLSKESRGHFAELGRRLLSLITRYIAEPSKREETIKLARDVGHDFGETLAKLGLSLTDSVEAFILHRNPILSAATQMMGKKAAFSGRVVEAIPLATHILDEVLVSLVATHQQYTGLFPKQRKGGGTD